MLRIVIMATATALVLLGLAAAQEGIRTARIKSVDAARQVITLVVDGHDLEFEVTGQTRFFESQATTIDERLKEFPAGTRVLFKTQSKNGKLLLEGIRKRPAGNRDGEAPPPPVDTTTFKPLTELGAATYHGFAGGLYPEGKNERPQAHEAAGLALANRLTPLDAEGEPAADGKIVLLAIGMSNAMQAFGAFKLAADADPARNPQVVLVNGAQGGMTASIIQNAADGGRGFMYWKTVDERLIAAGVTVAQVQAVWVKQADAGPTSGFPQYAETLRDELARIVQILPSRFPNVKLAYLSSRTFGGYAKTRLNPEPYAYESGFAVKWLIEQQLRGAPELNYDAAKGAAVAPWLSWGPYLWANGATARADGFRYEAADFADDGTHESNGGQKKIARLMLDFFKSDSTSKPWFLKQPTNK